MNEVTQKQWAEAVADLHRQLLETRLDLLREIEEREFYRVRYYESQAMVVKQQTLLSHMNEQALGLIRAVDCVNEKAGELLRVADEERATATTMLSNHKKVRATRIELLIAEISVGGDL